MPFAHWTQCRLAAFLWVQTHVVNCPGENCPNAFTLRRATPVMRAHRACLCDFVRAADLSPDCRPLLIDKMPLAEPPPRGTRFGSPLVLSRFHWVLPEIVVEVS